MAIIVPTKDRPAEIQHLLSSISKQSIKPCQVIIIDSSEKSNASIVDKFPNLSLHYQHFSPPSAARQRNAGIQLLDDDADFVAFIDDDMLFEPGSFEKMAEFWVSAEEAVAGASFNFSATGHPGIGKLKGSKLSEWLGLYSSKPGSVSQSGWATAFGSVNDNTNVQWLPSGASVWRRKVLSSYAFDDYFDSYSYLEDLDFSFSVSRHYQLYIVADAWCHHTMAQSGKINMYRFGVMEIQNRFWLVKKHHLSIASCSLAILIRLSMTLFSGIIHMDSQSLQRFRGNLAGLIKLFFGSTKRGVSNA